jgi:hypothetical protein
MTEIYHDYNPNYNLSQIQNGPDGKIYVDLGYWWLPDTTHGLMNMNLSVINDPDQLGLSCDFDTATISLGGNWACYGLPNSPYYNMPAISCIDTTLGITQYDNAGQFQFFPNPAEDRIYFSESVYVELTDLSGKRILEAKNCETLNIADLAPGIYFINFYSGNGNSVRRKLIKK